MSNRFWRIGAKVPASVRARLLEAWPARFPLVYCDSITWAYKVDDAFEFPQGPLTCVVTGRHEGVDGEAFVVTLAGQDTRPDGKRLHITLSTAEGVQRATAGNIQDRFIERIPLGEEVVFMTRLERFPLWKSKPMRQVA
jgi:hypothetical protein